LKDYFEKYQKFRLIKTNISVVISISVVLFLLGILGFFVLNSKKITNHFKEKVVLTVFFKDKAKITDIKRFEKQVKLNKEVKSTVFVSKKQASESLKKELGEDFIHFLGYNPLQNSLEINLKGDFVNEKEINTLINHWKKNKTVADINYDYYKPVIKVLNENIKKMSFWIGIVSLFFIFLIFLLINSAIRLSIYSKRISIHTMQMVGATKGFIRKPFLKKAVVLGIVGSMIAIAGLYLILFYLDDYFPGFNFLKDYNLLALLFSVILLIGIIITSISTIFATNHFLSLNADRLHQ